MFSDNAVAEGFICGTTKYSYIICFGVSPYMKAILDDSISSLDTYVALFDELFNKSAKEGQMDLHVCFWDKKKCCVMTCYYNSEFPVKASAQDLYEKFISCLLEIEPNKLLQMSSDGPNVNLACLDILNRFREDNEQPHLVNIGICRLHTLHDAFKSGEKASGWNTNKLLSAMYKIFD